MNKATSIAEVKDHMMHNGKSVAVFKTGRREYIRSVFGSSFFWAEDGECYGFPSQLVEYIELLPIVKDGDDA